MKSLLAAFLILALTSPPQASIAVVAVRSSGGGGGGGGNLLSETFGGATGGYDNTWTETGTGTIDQDETTLCGTGTGWSTDCLELTLTGSQTGATTSAFTAQTGNVWVRVRTKLTYVIGQDNDSVGIVSLSDATAGESTGSVRLQITRFSSGTVYEVSIRTPGGEMSGATTGAAYTTSGTTSATQYCYEFFMNNTTNDWKFWLNGTLIGEGNDSNIALSPTNLWLQTHTLNATTTETNYVDDVQVSNASRQTCS